jgi:hypothetical protein
MIQNIIDGFKTLLKEFDLIDSGDFETVFDPAGTAAIQIESVTPINPAVSDAVIVINIMGMTTADADPDKAAINKLYSDIGKALQNLTIEDIRNACKCQAELWYRLSSTPPAGGDGRVFSIQYNLTIQDFTL